jgi:transcriptional regulator with XRE-family HTH domain
MTFDTLREKLLSDPEVKAYYDELKPEFDVAKELISMRKELGLTQRELAEQADIKQPQLARIESGKQSPRLETLAAIASKVGYSVEIRLVPNQILRTESPASRRSKAASSVRTNSSHPKTSSRKRKSNVSSKEALETV